MASETHFPFDWPDNSSLVNLLTPGHTTAHIPLLRRRRHEKSPISPFYSNFFPVVFLLLLVHVSLGMLFGDGYFQQCL